SPPQAHAARLSAGPGGPVKNNLAGGPPPVCYEGFGGWPLCTARAPWSTPGAGPHPARWRPSREPAPEPWNTVCPHPSGGELAAGGKNHASAALRRATS